MARTRSRVTAAAAALTILAGAWLVRPAPPPEVEFPDSATPFRWDADSLFVELQARFEAAATAPVGAVDTRFEALRTEADSLLSSIRAQHDRPDSALERLAVVQFELAVEGAARPGLLPEVATLLNRTRREVMRAAITWPPDRATHEGIYRILHGGRIALDEALAQAGFEALPALTLVEDIPSSTPSVMVEGVRVHSGDILLSRGGAPTSALIARGNDFPNTFSHAALAHVDAETGRGTVIESLIESGAVLSSVEEYLESKKHRILVLRLRPDHEALGDEPLLPHRAAQTMIERVRASHVPYDFAMDWESASSMFCSEVVYHAFAAEGVQLWSLRSAMSAPGLTRWLAYMGVREFTSLVPSDLELDPQVRAVAEWRDAPELMSYRVDNAILDVLLEEAEEGAELSYSWTSLPPARLLKLLSLGQSLVGFRPTIPAGMGAPTALRVNALVSTIHPVLDEAVRRRAAEFREENGYEAPYWILVDLAREELRRSRASLGPALSGPA